METKTLTASAWRRRRRCRMRAWMRGWMCVYAHRAMRTGGWPGERRPRQQQQRYRRQRLRDVRYRLPIWSCSRTPKYASSTYRSPKPRADVATRARTRAKKAREGPSVSRAQRSLGSEPLSSRSPFRVGPAPPRTAAQSADKVRRAGGQLTGGAAPSGRASLLREAGDRPCRRAPARWADSIAATNEPCHRPCERRSRLGERGARGG